MSEPELPLDDHLGVAHAPMNDLCRIAARICTTPVAWLLVEDRQRDGAWLQVGFGELDGGECLSICIDAAKTSAMPIVADLAADPRFAGHRLAAGGAAMRFLAGAPVRMADGRVLGVLCVLDERPRTLDADQLDLLRALAAQVGVLLEGQEVERAAIRLRHDLQHRFKNSLQSIDSLISLQGRTEATQEGREAMLRLRERLRPLYLVEDCRSPRSAGLVDLHRYVHAVVRSVAGLPRYAQAKAELTEQLAEVAVARERAFPIGLIVREFLSNSLSHAVPRGAGSIAVELERLDDGLVRLAMADDGPGLASGEPVGTRLGLPLIQVLCRQIGAMPNWQNDQGTRLVLEFAADQASAPSEF